MNREVSHADDSKHAVQRVLFDNLSDDEHTVIANLRQFPDGVNVNELTILLNKLYSKLSSQLLEMELVGEVKCLSGRICRMMK